MPDQKGELLFGNVAVTLGFVKPDQVKKCAQVQEQLLALGVRKPVGEIMREKGWLSAEQVKAVCDYQEYRKERSVDKKFGEVAVSNGFVTEDQLRDCLAYQKEFFKNNQKTYPLGKILVDRGHLTDQQLRALLKLQQRLTQPAKAAAPKTQAGVRECGNCFEIVPIRAEKCPKCGNFFGKLALQAKCKVCGTHQTAPGEYCFKCGANLLTGEVPHPERVRQCNKCGKIGASYHEECLHCGHIWDATMKREKRHQEVAVKNVLVGLWRWAVLAAILIVGVVALLNFKNIQGWFAKQAKGEDRVAVENHTNNFLQALKFKDSGKVLSYYGARAPKEGLPGVYGALFKLDPDKVQVSDYKIDRVEAQTDSASSYVTVTFKAIEGKTGTGSLEEQLQNLDKGLRGGGNDRSLTLRWTRQGADWLLQP